MKKYQLTGFFITAILGTLLHFTYDWSGGNLIVGVLGAVNESTWEHLKLLFVPMAAFAIVEFFMYGKNQKNFIPVKLLSILLGMAIIVVVFYTYTGIIGKNYAPIDILLFYVAAFAAYKFSAKMLETEKFSSPTAQALSMVGFAFLAACFVLFTFSPPHIQLFLDPVTGTYGV